MSPDSARRAEALGYTNVKIFAEGIPAWKKAGKILISEPASLKNYLEKDIAHVIIDLRSAEDVKKGFIKGAVIIPEKDIASAKERFPSDKAAPIILYSHNVPENAFTLIRSWGYKETSVLAGGIQGWKGSGGQLETGNMNTVISYVPKPRPGEISKEEFTRIAGKGDAGVLILDVRDEDEAAQGIIKGAKNVPASKIKERLAEIPKDKEVITHCTTGIRAENAYEDLKENGYRVRYLNAIIQIDKDGRYEITKK